MSATERRPEPCPDTPGSANPAADRRANQSPDTHRPESTGAGLELTLWLNGAERAASHVPPGDSLLTALRDHFGLTGSKNACEQGECGSCTVYLDGEAVCACLVAAGQAQGRTVRTVEGLDGGGGLDAVQRAFVTCGAVQCGFCTPGFVVAVHDLIHRVEDPGEDDIREALAGNLCRCTGYEKIIDAVRAAALDLRARRPGAPAAATG